jgi:hypothetical protein
LFLKVEDLIDFSVRADGSTNNGNMQSQTITVPNRFTTQNYTYDKLNRLQLASETTPNQAGWK